MFTNAGTYRVIATNLNGSSGFSSNVYVTVVQPPASLQTNAGANVVFRAQVAGSAPLTDQWQFNGTNLAGASSTNLSLTNIQSHHAGTYTFLVANAAGQPTGFSATLAVGEPDTDGDGIPDDWEIAYGLDKDSPADSSLDPDGDAMTNLQEYIAGTNPTNALSYLHFSAVSLQDGQLMLEFIASSNRTYSVEARTLLHTNVNTNWSRVINVPSAPSNRLVQVSDVLSGTQRVYRILAPATD